MTSAPVIHSITILLFTVSVLGVHDANSTLPAQTDDGPSHKSGSGDGNGTPLGIGDEADEEGRREGTLAVEEAAALAELQRLAAENPSRIHATRRFTRNGMGWKWSVYLPPGRSWKLRVAVGRIPHWTLTAAPRDEGAYLIERADESRVLRLEAHISRKPGNNWMLMVEADRNVFAQTDLAAWSLEDKPEKVEVLQYVLGTRTDRKASMRNLPIGRVISTDKDRLELVCWRFGTPAENSLPQPDSLLPGFCLWIDAHDAHDPRAEGAYDRASSIGGRTE